MHFEPGHSLDETAMSSSKQISTEANTNKECAVDADADSTGDSARLKGRATVRVKGQLRADWR